MKLTLELVTLLQAVAETFATVNAEKEYDVNEIAGLANIAVEVTEKIWELLDK